jgi:uncharacterized membrane protein YadS
MPGTFADKATLASDNAFINKCRAAMIFRANELMTSATAQTVTTLDKMQGIMASAGSGADRMAWIVACGNSAIGAAAPAVPSDSDTQFAVNTFLAQF